MQIRATYRDLYLAVADRSVAPVYFLVTIMAAYALVAPFLYAPHVHEDRFIADYLVLGALVFGGLNVTYAIGTRAFRVLLRSIICFALFYVVTSHFRVTDDLLAADRLAAFELNAGWIIAALCGVVGLFRPSFGLVPLLYMVWQKHQLMNVFAFHLEWMDYFTLIETGTVLILGILIFAIFRRFFGLDGLTWSHGDGHRVGKTVSLHPADLLVILAVALHFGNYFYAGAIKAVLGGDPSFWVLNNQTQILLLAALESAVLPISFSEGLTALAYRVLDQIKILTNFVTILIQLLAVVAILRLRWAIIATLCYDVLHLTIFFLTGIFFWKFIILNLAIVAALAAMRVDPLPRVLKYVFAAAVVLSPYVFHIMPSFAWLDSRSMNLIRLVAVTDDGREYRVPSNYFLGMSVTLAQQRMVWPKEGPVPLQTWGTTRNWERMEQGLACAWGYQRGDLPTAEFHVSKDAISRFVHRYHRQVASMLDDRGHFNYDLFPHHIFSMPWLFPDFKALDKRRIVKYRYENEAVCLDFKDGAVQRKRMWSSRFDIPL